MLASVLEGRWAIAAVVFGLVGNAGHIQLLCECRPTLSQTPVPSVTVFKVGAKVVNTVTIGEVVVGSVGTIRSLQEVSLADARNHITKHDLRHNMTEAEVLQDWKDVHGKILWPRVRFTVNGGLWSTLLVKPVTMNGEDKHGEWVCSRVQVPLLLAYALTVHRAQGMTLKKVFFHMAGIFAVGQLYTALSRVDRFDNLKVMGNFSMKMPCSHAAVPKFEQDTTWHQINNGP